MLVLKTGIPAPGIFIVGFRYAKCICSRQEQGTCLCCSYYWIDRPGLIDLLEDEEMEAVLAYELTHINIKNSSIGIVTFSWILAGVLIALVYFAFWGAIFTGFGQKDDPAPQPLKFFVTALVAPIAATIIQLTTRHHH